MTGLRYALVLKAGTIPPVKALWVPTEKITVTQTCDTKGQSAVTFSGEFHRRELRETTGFAVSRDKIAMTNDPRQRSPEA